MAIKKEISSDLGAIAHYHNISKIKFDYLLDIIDVDICHYADESMRNIEKEVINETQSDIEKYYDFVELDVKDDLTNTQRQEFSGMNIQELEAFKVPQTFMGETTYKLEDTGIDFRENLYKEIVKIIPQLQNSKEV
jgi:hypothetical protein